MEGGQIMGQGRPGRRVVMADSATESYVLFRADTPDTGLIGSAPVQYWAQIEIDSLGSPLHNTG